MRRKNMDEAEIRDDLDDILEAWYGEEYMDWVR